VIANGTLNFWVGGSIYRQLTNEKWRLKAFYVCANFTFTVIANWRLMRPHRAANTAHPVQ